jgi:hypothetical protein
MNNTDKKRRFLFTPQFQSFTNFGRAIVAGTIQKNLKSRPIFQR